MKKTFPIIFGIALLLALAACSKASDTADSTSDDASSLSQETQLLVGTFKLEDTDQAVSADQAGELLPLWQTLQALSSSDTAAEAEIQAVVDQIESTMSSQQMDKIATMNLTQEDVMTVMRDSGFGLNSSDASGTPAPNSGTGSSDNFVISGDGAPPSGGFQGGAPDSGGGGARTGGGDMPMPSGGGGMPGGDFPAQDGSGSTGGFPGASGTPAAGVTRDTSNWVPAPLLNALIELLQSKIQS